MQGWIVGFSGFGVYDFRDDLEYRQQIAKIHRNANTHMMIAITRKASPGTKQMEKKGN